MLREFNDFKRQTAAKDDEIRTLQTSMGEMQSENEKLKNENESKSACKRTGLLDQYYNDVYGQASDTKSLLDLDKAPLSKKALD